MRSCFGPSPVPLEEQLFASFYQKTAWKEDCLAVSRGLAATLGGVPLPAWEQRLGGDHLLLEGDFVELASP